MEESHERYGFVFDEQPEPVITDPNAIIRPLTRQMRDVWDGVQGCALLDLFQHGLHFLENRVLADLL